MEDLYSVTPRNEHWLLETPKGQGTPSEQWLEAPQRRLPNKTAFKEPLRVPVRWVGSALLAGIALIGAGVLLHFNPSLLHLGSHAAHIASLTTFAAGGVVIGAGVLTATGAYFMNPTRNYTRVKGDSTVSGYMPDPSFVDKTGPALKHLAITGALAGAFLLSAGIVAMIRPEWLQAVPYLRKAPEHVVSIGTALVGAGGLGTALALGLAGHNFTSTPTTTRADTSTLITQSDEEEVEGIPEPLPHEPIYRGW